MIRDYEIRGVKGEETLYLYFDFDSEFAKLKSGEKKKKLKEIIKDYLKEKNIEFNGKKIAIISGGLLVATLTLKSPSMSYNTQNAVNNPYDYASSVVLMQDEEIELPKLVVEEQQPAEEITEKTQSTVDTSNNKNANIATAKKDTSNKSSSATGNKPLGGTTASKPTSNPTHVETPAPAPTPEPAPIEIIDTNTYVTVQRSNGQTIRIELEEYITGVVGAEMPASFNVEALKAQAVIARTYAMKALERGTTLTDNSSTQNYKTNDQLKAMWGLGYQTYYNKIKNAVDSTKGMYLTYNGAIIEAVYHSTSNGRTEDSKYVWGNAFPYLVSVDSPYDNTNSSFQAQAFFSYEELDAKLGVQVTEATPVEIVSRTDGMRVLELSVGGAPFTGVVVRSKLGLRSADFDITPSDGGYIFTTRGYGHGVGLSQYGANGMAKAGSGFEEILKHYYTGVTISRK